MCFYFLFCYFCMRVKCFKIYFINVEKKEKKNVFGPLRGNWCLALYCEISCKTGLRRRESHILNLLHDRIVVYSVPRIWIFFKLNVYVRVSRVRRGKSSIRKNNSVFWNGSCR